jgi:hypothetical protein
MMIYVIRFPSVIFNIAAPQNTKNDSTKMRQELPLPQGEFMRIGEGISPVLKNGIFTANKYNLFCNCYILLSE